MASKKEMPSNIKGVYVTGDKYSFNNPLLVSDLAASLFNRSALSDTMEDEQEGRQKGKKRRDDE